MRCALLLTCFTVLAAGQQPPSLGAGEVYVSASHQTCDGYHCRATGNAEMKTSAFTFRADTIDYDSNTTIMRLNGHVEITGKNRKPLEADEAEYDTRSGELRLKVTLAH